MTAPVRLDHLVEAVTATHPEPLDALVDAVRISERLGEVADHLVGHFVDEARRAGASWAQIGTALGVTRQAVQKRFVPKEGGNPFERFSEAARRVVVTAQETARTASNDTITPGHLLVALLAEDAVREVLAAQGVDAAAAETRARAGFGPAVAQVPVLVPFDAPTRSALERVVRTDDPEVGPVHLLLAVLDGEGSDGLLIGLGTDRSRLVAALAEVAHQPG